VNQEEPSDCNIPDRFELEQIRRSASMVASEVADRQSSREDLAWAENSGPGSLLWYWAKALRLMPKVAGAFGLVIATLTPVGWVAGIGFLKGGYLGAPPIAMASTILLGLVSVSMLLLATGRQGRQGRQLRGAGQAVALVAALGGLFLFLSTLAGGSLIDWAQGPWAEPDRAAVLLLTLIALGQIIVSRGEGEDQRQEWVIGLTGVFLLFALFTRGFQGSTLVGQIEPPFSYSGVMAAILLFLGLACLRPQGRLASFMVSTGPGPSMARLLVPLAVAIPVFLTVTASVASHLARGEQDLRGIDGLIVVLLLIGIIFYASRRLQSYYDGWKEASSEIYAQASVLGGMAEGVCVVRVADDRIVLTNPQFDHMHGWDRGSLVGERIDVVAPSDLSEDELRDRLETGRQLAASGRSTYECRAVCRDGTTIWCRVNAIISHDPVFGPVMILVRSDITSEHEARQSERRADRRFRQVFDQSPIGLCLVAPGGGFNEVNRSFEAITGYSRGELLDMTFAEITHPDDLEKDLGLTRELFAGKRDAFRMEKRYIRRNGETVRVLLTATMLYDIEGRPSQALSMIEDITERHRLKEQLQYLADHDSLTGLLNRRRFEEELNLAIAAGHGGGTALLAIDLDNFKFVNDSYGHTVGDRLLASTGEKLRTRLRSGDLVARQGGDEFVVLLRDVDSVNALAMAKELVQLISREVRVHGAEKSARVTASIGVAVASGDDPAPAGTLMMQADVAMYEAKDSGRNGARLFENREHSRLSHGIDLVGRLRSAIENDELLVYAQPLVRLGGGGRQHFELFVRMREPNGELVPPGAFLPVAERHDLVQEMDAWVIRRAIATLSGFEGSEPPRLQVNLSGRTITDPGLPDFVRDELTEAGVDPGSLIFEITETSAIGNMTSAQELSSRISELGCGFALDDFGTGFASFYYLKHISFDYVKIDGEFVTNLSSDPVNQLLVRSLVNISRQMGKLIVAEHVEDAATLAMLRDIGVDFAQGFHLGRPRPLAQTDLAAVVSEPPVRPVAG